LIEAPGEKMDIIGKLKIINDLDILIQIESSADNISGDKFINTQTTDSSKYNSLGLLPGEEIELNPIKNTLRLEDIDKFSITIKKAYPLKDEESSILGSCTFGYCPLFITKATITTSNLNAVKLENPKKLAESFFPPNFLHWGRTNLSERAIISLVEKEIASM
jgi:hypothetical protein